MYPKEGGGINDEIIARTSSDGINWTPKQRLFTDALGGVSAACTSYGECAMTYIRGDQTKPDVSMDTFEIKSDGSLIITDRTIDKEKVQTTPAVEGAWDGQSSYIFMAEKWSSWLPHWINGRGANWVAESRNIPFYSPYQWNKMTPTRYYRPDIVADNSKTNVYSFSVASP